MITTKSISKKIEEILNEDDNLELSYNFSILDSISNPSKIRRTFTGKVSEVGKRMYEHMMIAKKTLEEVMESKKAVYSVDSPKPQQFYIDNCNKVKDAWVEAYQEFKAHEKLGFNRKLS